jgi:hypothetical protein
MKIGLINMERIKNLGIGLVFMGAGLFIATIMILWLLYNIFISSKG